MADNNLSFKHLVDLFTQPSNYSIQIEYDSFGGCATISLAERGVKIIRCGGSLEVLFTHRGYRYLVTIPITAGQLSHNLELKYQLSKVDSKLFAPYKVVERDIISNTIIGARIPTMMVIVNLPSGVPLVEYLDGASNKQIFKVYGAIDILEEELARHNIYFTRLTAKALMMGDDGLIYPLSYHKIRFGSHSCCDTLRSWIASHYGVHEHAIKPTISGKYGRREEFEGHLEIGSPHEDRILVEDLTGFGFVDGTNSVVIPSNYIWADDFREGRAEVECESGLGLIDIDGREVIPAIYESLGYNADTGVTSVRKGGLWGYFSYIGEQLTPFIFEYPNEDISLREVLELNINVSSEI